MKQGVPLNNRSMPYAVSNPGGKSSVLVGAAITGGSTIAGTRDTIPAHGLDEFWPKPAFCSTVLHPKFYGQSYPAGIPFDAVVYSLYFQSWCHGVFVEVGANNGEEFSQSLMLEESMSWKGVCIEPQPNMFAELVNRRPKCHNVHAGVTDAPKKLLNFVQVIGPSQMLSGFQEFMSVEHRIRMHHETNNTQHTVLIIPVPTEPLRDIFAHMPIPVTYIDMMSIDTEGSELSVLRSIDWAKTIIGLFFIESDSEEKSHQIDIFLQARGYVHDDNVGWNLVYRLPSRRMPDSARRGTIALDLETAKAASRHRGAVDI